LLTQEIKSISAVWNFSQNSIGNHKNKAYTPKIISHGTLMIIDRNLIDMYNDLTSESTINTNDRDVMSYVIMPRYGTNLDKLFKLKNNNFSKLLIYRLGI